ncbi:MAG: translational GTPase TypA [Acidimicrobiales bacterium]
MGLDIRNVAIIAHVDHGKTTLVDAMLRQSGAFRENQDVQDRILDSMDLEREKGITILAKNIALWWGETKINIVDTPGHADFGGEVERGLTMVDGAILLVDAAEGPLPQTRFVLRKALEAHLPIVVVINKVDRPDARPDEVHDEILELFIDLGATEEQIEFPVLYSSGRAGWATHKLGEESTTLAPLFETLMEAVPALDCDPNAPLQALVSNIDASPYLGRLAVCRIINGVLRKGENVAWYRRDGSSQRVKIGEVFVAEHLLRVPADLVEGGDIAIISGIPEVTIGETLTSLEDPRPLPPIEVEEPAISMTLAANTSILSGREGTKVTARLIKARLDQELIGNISIRVLPTDRPDTFEVQGRGELALAVLIELMRREGFELTVGKPTAITRVVDGVVEEPFERLEVDVPEEHFGALTQSVAVRRATLQSMNQNASGWIRAIYQIPARGLLGLRNEVLSNTKGTAIIHHAFDAYRPYAGEIRTRTSGSLLADRSGVTTSYALLNLQERGQLFVNPGDEVYEGMVIGENTRTDDMDVNPTKEKKLTNMRSSVAEELVRLSPPRIFTLESALEFIADDECVEVTPKSIRVRKVILDQAQRGRSRSTKS